jgi:hypothetical protein
MTISILVDSGEFWDVLTGRTERSKGNAFWFITKVSTQMRGGWYSFESRYIKNIPIPVPGEIQKSKIELLVIFYWRCYMK